MMGRNLESDFVKNTNHHSHSTDLKQTKKKTPQRIKNKSQYRTS